MRTYVRSQVDLCASAAGWSPVLCVLSMPEMRMESEDISYQFAYRIYHFSVWRSLRALATAAHRVGARLLMNGSCGLRTLTRRMVRHRGWDGDKIARFDPLLVFHMRPPVITPAPVLCESAAGERSFDLLRPCTSVYNETASVIRRVTRDLAHSVPSVIGRAPANFPATAGSFGKASL